MANPRQVWFHRRLINERAGTNGGNLKLRDYYNHFASSAAYAPQIHFSPDTVWNQHPGNHWADLREAGRAAWNPQAGDLMCFSGGDWRILSAAQRRKPPCPIINVVQPRHSRAGDPRRAFLQFPAIRVAKSAHGADILRSYGVNGPLVVIPDAIELGALPPLPPKKDIDLLILGLKEPETARQLVARLRQRRPEAVVGCSPMATSLLDEEELSYKQDVPTCGSTQTPRPTSPTSSESAAASGFSVYVQLPPKLPTRLDFLRLVARARVVCCLPLAEGRGAEGFYLPALEAMALQALVVCPHAVGNRDHCQHEVNCLVPDYRVEELLNASLYALQMDESQRAGLIRAGLQTARAHDLSQERRSLLQLADRADALWAQDDLFLPSSSLSTRPPWLRRLFHVFSGS